ncbi:hypothetical protein [Marivirga sp.]|uniref:hypothetical protein n=1 Tax=Marivirga sp. TaxID=2018662 RepID=UPI003DA6DD7E
MIKRTCLIIDDNDQSEEIESLQRRSKEIHGIELICHQFNIGNSSFTEVLTNGLIDQDKVVAEFKKRFGGINFNIVALDYDLEDTAIKGTDLIRIFNHYNLLKKSPKMIYSGILDDVLKDIIRDLSLDKAVTKIKSMVRNKVIDYLDRNHRDSQILKFLSEDPLSSELLISNILNSHPDLVFENNFVSDKFKGKTFAEIAEMLDENITLDNEFKKEIIEQVISYLTEKI